MTSPANPESRSLESARQLAQARRWPELARLADTCGTDETDGSAELPYLFGDALRRVGRPAEAGERAKRAHAGALRAGDRRLELRSMNLIGMIEFDLGDLASAGDWFELLLERATELADDEFAARASNNLGILANIRGRRELALTYYQRSLAAYHRLGYTRGLAQTHYNLGISYRDLGFLEEAERNYATAIQYGDVAESEDVTAHSEVERAYLRARAGDGDLAEAIAERALATLEAMEDPGGIANALRILAVAAEARGDATLALERLDRAAEILTRHRDLLLEAEIESDRGRLYLGLGERGLAIDAVTRAADAYSRLGAEEDERVMRTFLAEIVAQTDPLS